MQYCHASMFCYIVVHLLCGSLVCKSVHLSVQGCMLWAEFIAWAIVLLLLFILVCRVDTNL